MAEIQKTPKTRMTNSELLIFCSLILNYLKAVNLAILKFKNELNLFDDRWTQFNNSLNKISKTTYWMKVKILKPKINSSRSGFYNLVLGEKSSQDPATRAAAEIVFPLMKRYTKMSRMKYSDFLKFLLNLVTECESDHYKDEIETLKLTTRVTALRTYYNEAMKLEESLVNDLGMNKRLRKSSITRGELCEAYDCLVKRLNALANIDGDEDYLELFGWWNALIDEYRNKIAYRIGSNKVGKTDDGESSQHDPNSGSEEGGGSDDDRPVIE